MGLESVINVIITSNSRGVSVKSFGVPLVIGYHLNWLDTYKVYSLGTIRADLITDGFTAYDPIYRACVALASNSPKTKNVVVGRLSTAFAQDFDIEIETGAAVEDKVLAFDVISPDGTVTPISYTVQSGDTPTLIATAIAALMNAIADMTASSVGAVITATADNNGEMFYLDSFDIEFMTFTDQTADSNLAAELAYIEKKYTGSYGLILADCESKARALILAAATETQEKIYGYTTHDTEVGNSASTTDIMYAMKAATYFRTFGIYTTEQKSYGAATWMGNRFPIAPGASTWAFKPLSGVTVDVLDADFIAAVEGKNGNYYTELGGLNTTKFGKMASGEWIDIIRGRDWLVARLRERIFGRLANSPKVPFTRKGAESIGSDVDAQMKEGINATYLSGDLTPPYIVTVPDVTDKSQVSDQNKIDRTLPGVGFECTLAGAIHIVDPLNGVIKV